MAGYSEVAPMWTHGMAHEKLKYWTTKLYKIQHLKLAKRKPLMSLIMNTVIPYEH